MIDISTLTPGYVADTGWFTKHETYPYGEMRSGFIKVKTSTTYIFKIIETTDTFDNWKGIGEYGENNNASFINRITYTVPTSNNIVFTTGETTNYIVVSARNLANATKIMLNEGDTAKPYEPYTGGQPSPNPDYRQEIKTVKDSVNVVISNKNFFDKNNVRVGYRFGMDGDYYKYAGYNATEFIKVKNNTTYSTSWAIDVMNCVCTYDKNHKFIRRISYNGKKFVTSNEEVFIRADVSDDKLDTAQIEEGDASTDYIEHEEQQITISTQEEMLEGDGFVEEDGVLYEEHTWGKKVLDGTENWIKATSVMENTSRFYFADNTIFNSKNDSDNKIYVKSNAFKGTSFTDIYGLNKTDKNLISNYNNNQNFEGRIVIRIDSNIASTVATLKTFLKEQYDVGTPIIVYYKLATPKRLPCTQEQNTALSQKNKTHTCKNITHFYSTGKVSPVFDIEYYKDLETINKQQNDRITALEQLLSTTATSAMLLDNMQSDLESEV